MTLAAVPDPLLGPLLDAAADALRGLEPEDVPVALRALSGFDRRGLASATARHQLRRAFDLDEAFRDPVVAAFTARPEARAMLDRWASDAPTAVAVDAAERDDLALLASALYAARPRDAEFGLGVCCAEDQHRRAARALAEDARARAAQLASAEEARRRADAALATVRADVARLEAELRDERRGRRERESTADRRVDDAQRSVREAEAALDRARRETELAEARARREAERARDAERRLRERSRDAAAPPPGGPRPPTGDALRDLARRARDLATELDRIASPAPPASPPGSASGVPPRPPGPERRVPAPCPPGLRADQPDGLDAMLRAPGVTLVVDGYNVSMTGWLGAAVSQQRDHLLAALGRLHLRVRCQVVVVFDGADVGNVPARRFPGVRVVFSAAGEPADPLIVREVEALPAHVPVLVASDDRWVRDEVTRAGATPVDARVLLAVARR